MNSSKRIVGYIALALAVLLACTIMISMLSGVFGLFHLLSKEIRKEKLVSYSEKFTGITSLHISSYAGNLTVKSGTEFEVVANNVSERFFCGVKGDSLSVQNIIGNANIGRALSEGVTPTVEITIPENLILEKSVIEAGVGVITIDRLHSEEFSIKNGAGQFFADNLTSDKTTIDNGAGTVEITNSTLTDLTMATGVGVTKIEGTILGKSRINRGVGNIILHLRGNTDDYNLNAKASIGGVYLNGESMSDFRWDNNTAQNSLEMSSGVGRIDINFEE